VELSKVSELVNTFLDLKKQIDSIEEKQIKPLNKKINEIQATLIKLFEENKLEKFTAPNGSVHLKTEERISLPVGDEKIKFVEYMKQCGEWDSFATIHSARLNSWFKEKRNENALFLAPGLSLPKETKYLKRGK